MPSNQMSHASQQEDRTPMKGPILQINNDHKKYLNSRKNNICFKEQIETSWNPSTAMKPPIKESSSTARNYNQKTRYKFKEDNNFPKELISNLSN